MPANMKILTKLLFRKLKLPEIYRIGRKFEEANEDGKLKKTVSDHFPKRH